LTTKHNAETNGNEDVANVVKNHACNCGKIYATRSGLWKHEKQCTKNRNEISPVEKSDSDYKAIIMTLINDNKELRDAMIHQSDAMIHQSDAMIHQSDAMIHQSDAMIKQNKDNLDTIKDLIPKIGATNITKIDTNINQNLNINVFLNEQCKDALNFTEFIEKIKVSIDELDNQIKLGYVNGVSKILMDNLNALAIYERPIHCTDAKRNTLYIKENDTWDKEGSQEILKKGIQEIVRKSHIELCKLKEVNSVEYADMDSKFSLKCIEIQRHITPVAPREVSIGKVISNVSKNTTLTKTIE
jgi:hypothetical protein